MNINQFTAADLTRLQAISQRLVDGYNAQDVFAANGDQKLGSLLQLIVNLALTGNLPAGIRCINKSGGTLAKAKPVSITGWDAATDCWVITVTAANTGWAVGVLDDAVPDGAQVVVKSNFLLEASGLDTSGGGVTAGATPVYANAGALSLTAPGVAKNNQIVGIVATKAASGSIRILPLPAVAPAVYIAAA